MFYYLDPWNYQKEIQIILSNDVACKRLEWVLWKSRYPHTSPDTASWQFSMEYSFAKIVYWYYIKIILQCIWRILITKKEGKYNIQPIALSCIVTINILCGTENTSKSMIGQRTFSPFRMHRACCSNQLLWFRVSTQDGMVLWVWVPVLVIMVKIWRGRWNLEILYFIANYYLWQEISVSSNLSFSRPVLPNVSGI